METFVHLCPSSSSASLVHPTKSWGQNPDPGDTTLGDDIERIRIFRNTVYGHVYTTEVSDAEFKRQWTTLENITIRIDNYLGSAYKKSLDDIKVSSLDLEAEKKFFDQIKKLAEELEKNKSEVDVKVNTVKNEMEGEITCLKTDITSVTEKQSDMSSDIVGLKTDLATVSETQGEMSSDIVGLKTDLATVSETQGKMSSDIVGLKNDITTVSETQDEMSTDIAGLKTKMDTLNLVNTKVAQLSSDMETLREDQGTMAADTKMEFETVRAEQGAMVSDLKIEIDTVATRLQKDLRQLKTSYKERYNVQLEEWKKEDSVFVETRACVNVRKAMKEKTFVTVSGNAGSGKSAMIHHLALEYKSKGFDVIPAKDPEDIEKYLQIDQEQLFVYDDPVGIHCLNKDKFVKWLDLKIESSKMTKKLKVLFSVRRQIVNELDFKNNCNVLNKTVMDIQDDKNKLTLKEKVEMIRQHATVRKTDLCVTNSAKDIIEKQEDLFPLACELRICIANSETDDPYVVRLEPKYVQDFVDRMLSELKKREFKNVFMNKCWSNDTFIDTFKATVRGTIEEETSQINHAVLDIFTEPQQFNEGITALHWIAAFGYSKLFTYIWGSLSSFQKATVGNMIPLLHFACLGGEIEIFNLILPDETDKVNMPLTAEIKLYPIHLSVYHNEDIILSLIKLGADINQKDLFHKTALFYTAGCKNTKICSILIHHDNKSGPCKYCRYINKIYNKIKCNIQSVSIENTEFNLNQTDIFGSSPLFLATSVNSIDVANLLLQHHADTNLCDKDGFSPLYIAAQNNSIDVAELLLQHHADTNLCNKDGFCPLYIASQNNSIDVADLL
ncbi:hypothetical protein KUTeg_006476 [Tegillarca granosa]|uniref:DZIP3-like HEPN domain-containing protein n=1 Tax=Tegillarca granosa TaxID=220873 RepID=A0ABQ9FGK9_TEGGR|nr:hypothetical protein KUTeg_006476 [Tegillarca granosa]